jgi:SulP family sulfate permease
MPKAFWLIEDGVVRADHVLEQGSYAERIVAGTTCGELPFLSGTKRTATASTETEVTAWIMEQDEWDRLWKEEPEVATEILRVGLKLAHERMSSITS